MPENPAQQLIQGCLDGDQIACAALFDQYKGLVYRTAYLMLSSAADAEDVLQDVFTQVFRSLATYDPARAAFSTWLHRVTVNACLSRQRRSSGPPLAALDEESLADAPVADDFTAALGLAEQAAWLLDALDGDQRVVVVLRFYHDLSYQEIAAITAVPLGTVQSRLGRALKRMRAAMTQWQKEES